MKSRPLPLLLAAAALVGLVARAGPARGQGPDRGEPLRFAIALHGGAGAYPCDLDDGARVELRNSLRQALAAGRDALAGGATSLAAIERTIRTLEDDPRFNAGRGAVLNHEGDHELDAAVMDGRSLACGAVAGVRTVRNPISAARLVMQRTEHVLLAGPGADRFAAEMGLAQVEQQYFRTEHRVRAWRRAHEQARHPGGPRDTYMGTVGCVALDGEGNLAAGTSTGGRTIKKFGRVGDSPLIGAGTYANNATCAVSCTGVGEEFIRHSVAHDISARMAYQGLTLAEASRRVLHDTLGPNTGGLVAVNAKGQIVIEFNTQRMYHAAADSTGRFNVGIGR